MIRLLLGVIAWLAFIAFEVRRNYRLIEKDKEKPDYLHSFFLRAFTGIVCLVIMFPAFDPATLSTWCEMFPYIVFEGTSFYLVFDPLLNIKRGKRMELPRKRKWLDGWLWEGRLLHFKIFVFGGVDTFNH